jgi:hypothetical protein
MMQMITSVHADAVEHIAAGTWLLAYVMASTCFGLKANFGDFKRRQALDCMIAFRR